MIDPSIAGKQLDVNRFPVDRSKLAELARALHDDDPVYRDPDAARAAGFAGIPAPPTATVLLDHWGDRNLAEMAEEDIGADLKRVLHGEAVWEYLRPIHAGDELTATRTVRDVTTREGKRGGTMTLVTIETEFAGADGEVVVRRTDTLIERGA